MNLFNKLDPSKIVSAISKGNTENSENREKLLHAEKEQAEDTEQNVQNVEEVETEVETGKDKKELEDRGLQELEKMRDRNTEPDSSKTEEERTEGENKKEVKEERLEPSGEFRESQFGEIFRKKEEGVYRPPYFTGTVEEPEKVAEEVFRRLRNVVLDTIGSEKYHAVKRYMKESNIDFEVALVDRTDEFSPKYLYQIFRDIADELKIPNVIFSPKAGEIDVRYADGKVKFFLDGMEVIPVYSLVTLPSEVLKGKRTAVLLPIDQWKILQTEAKVKQESSGKDIPSFKDILKRALQMKASDIHIIPKERGFFVFFRINKQLVEIPEFFMSRETWESFARLLFNEVAEHTVGNFRTDDFRVVNEGRIDYSDFRVTVRFEYIPDGYSLKYGEIVCRILKREGISGRESLKERLIPLGYEERDVEVLEKLTLLEGGLIVISGKTNSGKSTLTANILASIPKHKKVETIEDPIEYIQDNPNVVQHQVYLPPEEKEQLGPLEYVKAFKRADSDVVLVGEWRNYPGLTEAMVEQAQAGQLIFTTLHITSAYEIYEALYNIFKVPYEISAGLILFSFNQSLVPKLCPHCSLPVEIAFTEEELLMSRQLTRKDRENLLSMAEFEGRKRNPKGCKHCSGTGIKGLVPIYEFFVPNEDIRNEVIKQKSFLSPLMLKELVEEIGLRKKGLAKFKVDTYLKAVRAGLIEKEILFTI